jgi:hypothetical protein
VSFGLHRSYCSREDEIITDLMAYLYGSEGFQGVRSVVQVRLAV